jgi:hypothetical protein
MALRIRYELHARNKTLLAKLSEADWTRIRVMARQVNQAYTPPALTDLSVPVRVTACMAGQERRFPGERVGTVRGGQVALIVSEIREQNG